MIIFNDNLEMHWDNVDGVPHGQVTVSRRTFW